MTRVPSIAHRPPRPRIRARPGARCPLRPPDRAGAFARRLLERLARWGGAWTGLSRVFRTLPASAGPAWHLRLHVHPVLLRQLHAPARAEGLHPPRAETPLGRVVEAPRRARITPRLGVSGRLRGAPEIPALPLRSTPRFLRVEQVEHLWWRDGGDATGGAALPHVPAAPKEGEGAGRRPRRVSLVYLRRSAAPAADPATPATRARAERAHAVVGRAEGGSASGAGGPALDVAGLTDQVIQAIDRRIVAQRERLGRG